MGLMRDSKMPDSWITNNVAKCPIQKHPNGNLITCPVRLAFADVIAPKKRTNDDGSSKEGYGAALLFPPGAEPGIQGVLYAAWYEEAKRAFPNNFKPDGTYFGLHWPFHLCDDKQNYTGYTPGLYYVNVSSQFKPQIVDLGMNPIVDPARVYAGVWAVCALNIYSYGVSPPRPKKGVSFGLQNIVIIGDDEKLAGGGTDPKADFGGLNIDANYDAAMAFAGGQRAAGAVMPPPGSVMPPPAQVPGLRPPPAPPAASLDYDPLA